MEPEQVLGRLPDGWHYAALGDVCRQSGGGIQTGPFGSQLHASDYVPFGIPSIMPQDIGDNRVVEESVSRVSSSDAKRLSRYLVWRGDVVCSRRGDVGRRALIREREEGWLCGTGCLRIRLGSADTNSVYLSYYLGHPSAREWIERHAHGATMPNLNTSILAECPVVIPPPAEQRAIAHILGTLDDKIELNRRTSVTLEAMGRALFKSWFVDFEPVRARQGGRGTRLPASVSERFRTRLVTSDLGVIPSGWDPATIADELTVTMGQSPPGHTYDTSGEGMAFYQGRADFTFRFPTHRVFCTAPTRQAKVGDTLISVRAPVGDTNMAAEDCAIGRGVR